MQITSPADRPSRRGPAEWFTGTVRLDPLFGAEAPSRGTANLVTFEPGARTNWHTHPAGQVLICTQGVGRCCVEGGEIREFRAGDVIRFGPGVRHWHGASPDVAMSHIAIQEEVDGVATAWTDESVSDGDYGA